LLGRFRVLTAYSTALEALRIALVVGALAAWHSLQAVLAALVVYEVVAGIVNALAAAVTFRSSAETPLTRPALSLVRPERRELFRTVLHTNVLSYARISQVQVPALLIGALAGATQAGIYKVGMAGGAIVGRLSDPPYVALLPRISRLWTAEGPREVRSLIERATRISIPVMAIVALALIVLHDPVLRLLGGAEAATSAEGVFVLGISAQAVSGALFWNTGVLFAASRSRAMAGVAILGAAIQLALVPPLVLAWGATGAAAAFATSVVLTNAVATRMALRALRSDEPGTQGDMGAHEVTDTLLPGEGLR
jgi:O-antigen/teichoic acid export membrane protein